MSREIWVQHGYLVQATPARARKPRWFSFRTETPVRVAEAPAFENPRALVVARDREVRAGAFRNPRWGAPKARKDVWTKGNRAIGPSPRAGFETVTDWYGGHEGKLYRPLRPPEDRYAPLTLERVMEGNPGADFRDHPFLSQKQRELFHKLQDRDDLTNARMRDIHQDLEEDARAEMARRAADLLVVDGALWKVQRPALVVSLAEGGTMVQLAMRNPWFGSKESGIHFPVDRFPEALDFAESLAMAHGARLRAERGAAPGDPLPLVVDERRVVEADPACAAIDAPSMTARTLVNAVHQAARDAQEGAAGELAKAIMDSLGGQRPHRSLHVVGNPFDFADRIEGWADEALTLPADGSWERRQLAAFSGELRSLAAPIVHGRDRGLSAEADNAFFREEDFANFNLFDEPDEPAGFAP